MDRKKGRLRPSIGPQDDRRRSRLAVTVSALVLENDNKVRLVFDDSRQESCDDGLVWRHRCFYTSVELDRECFESCDLAESDFAGIGRTLIARLGALTDPM